MAYKSTSSAYELPGAKQVGGPLLGSLSAQYTRHSKENMDMYKEDYGMACMSDGATVNRTPLVNVLASRGDFLRHAPERRRLQRIHVRGLQEGRQLHRKEMGDAMAILGHKFFFLAILDGASNMQSAGRILMALNKQLTVVHCALHLVHLIFGQIALISEVAALTTRRAKGGGGARGLGRRSSRRGQRVKRRCSVW